MFNICAALAAVVILKVMNLMLSSCTKVTMFEVNNGFDM